MIMASLTNALRAEYQSLFDTCQVNPARQAEVEQIATKIIAKQARYQAAHQTHHACAERAAH
jgi:lysozyme family protein